MLSQLQKKYASVASCHLCGTMDLVALVAADGSLGVYRTLTWEKVLLRGASEVAPSGSVPTAVAFCSSGKVLGLGHQDGELSVLDIESGDILQSCRAASSSSSSSSSTAATAATAVAAPVVSVSWVCRSGDVVDLPPPYNFTPELVGMEEYFDAELGEAKDKATLEPFFQAAEGNLLLSLSAVGVVTGHLLGLFPLFSFSVVGMSLSLCASADTFYGWGVLVAGTSTQLACLPIPQLDSHALLERSAVLILTMAADLARLCDLVSGCGRKWKDATKVILPKLGLLQGVLEGYELPMSGVNFMYSLVHCGAWHPAASASFSQHWSEQNLSRLRSAVDSTTKLLLRHLSMRALPLATNTMLRCKELLHVLEDMDSGSNPRLSHVRAFARSLELLLFKLDETLHEARLAREAMLLYLAFVKEQCAPTEIVAGVEPPPKPDLSLAPKFLRLFDPRIARAAFQGPQGQAEHVTGTHLYAFLHDGEVPEAVVAERTARVGLLGLDPVTPRTDQEAVKIQHIFEMADAFAHRSLLCRDEEKDGREQEDGLGGGGGEGGGGGGGGEGGEGQGEAAYQRASLLQMAKDLRDRMRALTAQPWVPATSLVGMEPRSLLSIDGTAPPVHCSDVAVLPSLALRLATLESDEGKMRNEEEDLVKEEEEEEEEEEDDDAEVPLGSCIASAYAYSCEGRDEIAILVMPTCLGAKIYCARLIGTEQNASMAAETQPGARISHLLSCAKPAGDEAGSKLHIVYAGPSGDGDTCFLYKADLSETRFTPLGPATGAVSWDQVLSVPGTADVEVGHRSLPFRSVEHLAASASRGIVMVTDAKTCIVLDVDNLEEKDSDMS